LALEDGALALPILHTLNAKNLAIGIPRLIKALDVLHRMHGWQAMSKDDSPKDTFKS
jgi:hypothetical protein